MAQHVGAEQIFFYGNDVPSCSFVWTETTSDPQSGANRAVRALGGVNEEERRFRFRCSPVGARRWPLIYADASAGVTAAHTSISQTEDGKVAHGNV